MHVTSATAVKRNIRVVLARVTLTRITLATTALALTACAAYRPASPGRPVVSSPAQSPIAQTAAPPPSDVYAYPQQGQSVEQQDRDRYECHLWSVRQTGFDPSAANVAPHQRVRIVTEPPPSSSVIAGAVTGAVIGAVVGSPDHTGEGAVVGAVAGAAIGGIAEAERAEQASNANDAADARERSRVAALEQHATHYRRAVGACLTGRAYSVR